VLGGRRSLSEELPADHLEQVAAMNDSLRARRAWRIRLGMVAAPRLGGALRIER